MEVSIHLTDVDFSSRCALQDCYVIPAPCHKTVSIDKAAVAVDGGEVDTHVDTGTLPEGLLVSPYLLHPNKSNCSPRPLALLWRCGACGKEQCVAREAMSLFTQRSSKKGASRGISSRRSEPAVCPDCYACPRCNASALSISMSREVLYVACCSYCHWRHGVACKDFDGLLASLSAATASKMMLSYNRAVGEWRRSCDEKLKRREEMLLSLSRVANAEYKKGTIGNGGGAPQHSAVVLEELRSAIYGRTLKNRDNSPEWIPFSAPGEMGAATPCETPTASPEEGDKKGVVLFPDNADALTRTTQMEQHGFFFPSSHPFWGKQSESAATAPFLLMQNIRLPLTAMVIPPAQDGVKTNATAYQRDSSFLFVVNGVRRDPSFEQIVQVLQARGGSESRRCQLVTVKLAAAFCLPLLQQQSRHPASDESRRWFTWRNFGDDVLCIRRFTMEKQVGGVFDASLVISAGADASEWVSLAPRSGNRASVGETFCITLQRTAGASAMVGFVVEVQTMLPAWPGEGAEETPGAGAPSLVGETEGTTKRCPHVVRYGLTVTW
ncbi:hypothetical protein TcYC6_0082020 [Trypanosoma cruzi]|nr:hypothetical protein TcYC6_0082020 [Trypanosoma cruzi]